MLARSSLLPVSYSSPTVNASNELDVADLDLLDTMIDAMDQDIDSWCSSSIACCDRCFDAYAAKWPRAYISTDGIQYQTEPADMFYDSARRVQGALTKCEFMRLLPYVACPNCGGSLGPNLFAFELPFDPDEFQCDLERLAKLADDTPSCC